MCGIIGIFNKEDAVKQVETALAILKNRGKDGFGLSDGKNIFLSKIPTITTNNAVGHTLHAVVNHFPQPIKQQGNLVANCEIYNWQELNKKYSFGKRLFRPYFNPKSFTEIRIK